MSSDKTKAELEAEIENLKAQLAQGQKCPNCGFDATEHAKLVTDTTANNEIA